MSDHECFRCPECGSCPACAVDALDNLIEEAERHRERLDQYEAYDITVDSALRDRERLAAAEASAEWLAAGLRTIADRPCHEIRERGNHILWCPDHMPGGRAFWCDSCEARAVLAEVGK